MYVYVHSYVSVCKDVGMCLVDHDINLFFIVSQKVWKPRREANTVAESKVLAYTILGLGPDSATWLSI